VARTPYQMSKRGDHASGGEIEMTTKHPPDSIHGGIRAALSLTGTSSAVSLGVGAADARRTGRRRHRARRILGG
jgi:hypothetical protein